MHILTNNRVNNVLVRTAPYLIHSLFQFIDALDVRMVNTFLNGPLYTDSKLGRGIYAVWRGEIKQNKVVSFYTASDSS